MIVKSLNGWDLLVGVTVHKTLPTGLAVHVEGFVPMCYPRPLGSLSGDVRFDGHPAVKLDHDLGSFIPHYNIVPPLPPNPLLVAIIPSSSAKVVFARASVLVNGTPAAAHHLMMPLLLCGDPIKCPTGFAPTAYRNTVVFTYDPQDLKDGLQRILWENVKSKIARHLGGKQLGEAAGGSLGKAAGENIKKATEKLWEKYLWSGDKAARDAIERIQRKPISDPMEKVLKGLPLVGKKR
jgi:hypothetical protein